jgi:hypothetical protein
MPRPLKVESPGARYHAMRRGDRREDIFGDREKLSGLLGRAGSNDRPG